MHSSKSDTPQRRTPERTRESLKAMMVRKKREAAGNMESCVFDPYTKASSSLMNVKIGTGLVYDDDLMLKHRCDWDPNYPENEKRLDSILKRIEEMKLIERCIRIPSKRDDVLEKIESIHDQGQYDKLKCISSLDLDEMEQEASKYDAVYFNGATFDAACLAAASAVNLAEAVATNRITNGMALIRPPGHHAMAAEYCGYCYFNNVAIAAEHCIQAKLAKRILIVDYDVHHGHGTQQMFYERNDVLYFSIHRFEHGTFWPNLPESNFNFIGKGRGVGYNINVPLNHIGLLDSDYLAIVFHVLLPIAYEFNPDLVIVSAGYDAAIGCPEGQMRVSPAFYSHLITLLTGLADGRIVVCLEGGYFLPSLQEGAALTLKALLGDQCPPLEATRDVHPSVIESIVNVRSILKQYWKCFNVAQTSEDGIYNIQYYGTEEKAPFETRNCYPSYSKSDQNYFAAQVEALKTRYIENGPNSVAYVYDPIVLLHRPTNDTERPERPERLSSIIKMCQENGIIDRCRHITAKSRPFDKFNPHDKSYSDEVRYGRVEESNDIYVNDSTYKSIECSISNILNLIDDIVGDNSRAGIALVRPPGHHAEFDKAMGFCFINNVAVAANYLVQEHNVEKILIIDFDVHHGNGSQNFFYNRKDVMYVSVHRYDDGKFFPTSQTADVTFDGFGLGKGYNVNIPFNKDKMGDSEYLAVFCNIILPLAYSYAPEFILISAGFDAGINDPLGGGYRVSPELFGHFVQLLKPLAKGKLCVILEGGYNLTTLSYGVAMCFKSLLGDPIPLPDPIKPTLSEEACITIRKVSNHFVKYWPILLINTKQLGNVAVLNNPLVQFTHADHSLDQWQVLDNTSAADGDLIKRQLEMLKISGS